MEHLGSKLYVYALLEVAEVKLQKANKANDTEIGKVGTSVLNNPIGSMVLLYMVTFTINIPPMLAYIPYMDPMGMDLHGW